MKSTTIHLLAAAALMARSAVSQTPAVAAKPAPTVRTTKWSPPRTPEGHPDLQGIWTNASMTPLERAKELGTKEFFTPQEAEEWEKQEALKDADGVFQSRGVGTYNTAFREFGGHVAKTMRTSVITDPPDGRLPPLTPAAAAEVRRRQEAARHPASSWDLGLQDQCLIFPTAIPPMTPYSYNSNYSIVETGGELAIYVEMIHDTRVIPFTGRPHPPQNVRLWEGDSAGHWEGDTLVVDTTNFNDKTSFFGSDRNMHVVERFSLLDADTILYRFEVDDPTAFTRPFRGESTLTRDPGPIYEYACHEGNYALPALLRGARMDDQAAKTTKGDNK
jgi:hypothetical protein